MTGYNALLRVITCYYVIYGEKIISSIDFSISQNFICCARVLVMTGYNALFPVITCYYAMRRKYNFFTEFLNFSEFKLLRERSRYDRL